jgi:hypothetical protein
MSILGTIEIGTWSKSGSTKITTINLSNVEPQQLRRENNVIYLYDYVANSVESDKALTTEQITYLTDLLTKIERAFDLKINKNTLNKFYHLLP